MTKKTGKDGLSGLEALKAVEGRIGGLFEALGDVLSQAADGKESEIYKEFGDDDSSGKTVFHSRIRVGSVSGGSSSTRGRSTETKVREAAQPEKRDLHTEIFEGEREVIFACEVPGVSVDEVELFAADGAIHLKTTGDRVYTAIEALRTKIKREPSEIRVINGILEASFELLEDGANSDD